MEIDKLFLPEAKRKEHGLEVTDVPGQCRINHKTILRLRIYAKTFIFSIVMVLRRITNL